MSKTADSSPLGNGGLPETLASTYPLGMIFYPTETVDIDESFFEKEIIQKLKLEVLEALKETTLDIGVKIFDEIEIPPWFKKKDVCKKWNLTINKAFDEAIEKEKSNDYTFSKEDELLIKQFKLLRKIEVAINTDQKKILEELISNYQSVIKNSFKIMEDAFYSLRRKYSKIFFESKLNPEFMTNISKTINVMISYLHYLRSELRNVLTVFRQIITGRSRFENFKKNSKAVFIRIIKLDVIQLTLLFKIIELQIFMNMWSSKTIDELFESKKIYSADNLNNKYFEEILERLNKLSKELHYELIKITRERNKDVPFTFSKNINKKDEEKMYLISRIIHNI